jgi:hypothetical protein
MKHSVAVSLPKANCIHKFVMFCSVAAQLLCGSAYGEAGKDISMLVFNNRF